MGNSLLFFFAHVALVVLTTCQVAYYLEKDIVHAVHTTQHIGKLLLNSDANSVVFRHPASLQNTVDLSISNIFAMNDVTFNDVAVIVDGVEHPPRLPVYLTHRNGSIYCVNISRAAFQETYGQTYLKESLPILYTSDIRYLQRIWISFVLNETVLNPEEGSRGVFLRLISPLVHLTPHKNHFIWNITVVFDGTSVGTFAGKLTYNLKIPGYENAKLSQCGLHLLVLTCSIVAIYYIMHQVIDSAEVFLKIRRVTQTTNSEQYAIFSWWWALSLLSHGAQVGSTLFCMQTHPEVIQRYAWLGWSCCFAWFNMCQYLEFFPAYYVTFSTTAHGLAAISRYLVGIMPILTGFMILGTCLFWTSSGFSTFSNSYASLFSLLNGDIVHDTFNDLYGIAGMAGHMYAYVFIFIFIYIVLNVNITIIEEAYFAARFQGRKHEEQLRTPLSAPLSRQVSLGSVESDSFAYRPPAELAASGDMVLPNQHGGRSSGRRGSMAPRYLNNPSLQAALASAFPEEFANDHSHRVALLETEATCTSNDGLGNGFLGAVGPDSSPSLVPISPSCGSNGRARTASNVSDGSSLEEWISTISLWSQTLQRATAQPPQAENADMTYERIQELEQVLAKHSSIIDNFSAAIRMTR